MQARAQHSMQPVEDMNAILSRFHAWTGKQAASNIGEGFREISYEEALRKNRHWRPVYSDLPPIAPEKKEPPKQASSAAETIAQQKKPASSAKIKNRSPRQQANPEFRELLTKTLETSAQINPVSTTEISIPRRQTSLSVRLAASEQALIKTRAAEAGLSASAYMRQCALEVEQLRKQVEHALAAMKHSTAAPMPAPAPLPSIFSRLKRFFLGKHSTGLAVRA